MSSSSLYGRPPGGGSKKVVIALVAVVVVLLGLVLFLVLRPTSSGTATAPSPGAGSSTGTQPKPSGSAVTETGSAGSPPKSSGQWTIPVPGDGGPSTKSAAGVPRGYDASDAGATKAAVNAVVAARWMKFRVQNPAETLGELATPDAGTDRDAVLQQLTPKQIAGGGIEQAPAGGKVLGAQTIRRDAKTAVVHVLWEEFAKPASGKIAVTMQLVEVRLERTQDDWLVTYVDQALFDPAYPTKNVAAGRLGNMDESVPVPGEGWYW